MEKGKQLKLFKNKPNYGVIYVGVGNVKGHLLLLKYEWLVYKQRQHFMPVFICQGSYFLKIGVDILSTL